MVRNEFTCHPGICIRNFLSEELDCDDDSFVNELGDFAEISTIAVSSDQYVIINEEFDPEKSEENKRNYDDSGRKHERDDTTFE
jgi:hypothetical protein